MKKKRWKKSDTLEAIAGRAAPRAEPLPGLPDFVKTEVLLRIVKEHVGEDLPPKLGRDKLLAAALSLNLITVEQVAAKPPEYVSIDELRALLKGVKFPKGQAPKVRDELLAECLRRNLITAERAGAARQRLDIAAKRKGRAHEEEFCRTCTLSALLKGMDARRAIIDTATAASFRLSQIALQRSFLVWIHLYELLQSDVAAKDLPDLTDSNATFFRHCFTVRIRGCTTRDAAIEATLEKHRPLFPPLDVPPKMVNAMSHAAKLYKTCFLNHLTLLDNAIARARKLASYKLFGLERKKVGDELGENPLYATLCMIETGKPAEHPRVAQVAAEVRRAMGLPDGQELTERWLRANIWTTLRFVLAMAKDFDGIAKEVKKLHEQNVKLRKGAGKGVKWVPTHKVGRMMVKLDASDITAALLGQELKDSELAADVVREAFRPGIETVFGKKLADMFSGTIDTDGFRVSLHFTRERRPKAVAKKEEDEEPPVPEPRLKIDVDPGRINMATITVRLDGKPVMVVRGKKTKLLVFKLTAANYYSSSGLRIATMLGRKRRAAAPGLSELDKALQENGLRTGNIETIKAHLRTLNQHWESLWSFACSRAAGAWALRRRAGKQRAVDRFFAGVRKKLLGMFGKELVRDAVVVWGCAKVSPSGRGNLTVPTSGIAAVAARHWRVVPGDEYRTSSACFVSGCHCDLHEVRVVGHEVTRVEKAKGDEKFAHDVRHRFVIGLNHKRLLRRKLLGKRHRRTEEQRRETKVVRWVYDGHGGESEDVKKEKAKLRKMLGLRVRYLRGLRFCLGCMKPHDRDDLGSVNIGTIDQCKCTGQKVPDAFDRAAQRARTKPAQRRSKKASVVA